MRSLFGLLGATVLSSLGWWLGSFLGVWMAVLVSAVGGGVGLYAGRRLVDEFLG